MARFRVDSGRRAGRSVEPASLRAWAPRRVRTAPAGCCYPRCLIFSPPVPSLLAELGLLWVFRFLVSFLLARRSVFPPPCS